MESYLPSRNSAHNDGRVCEDKSHSFSDMEKKENQKNTTWKHLKPLSVYSLKVTCEGKASLPQTEEFTNPFINFKIEIPNSCQTKRKLDDSVLDSQYETLAKKAFILKDLSPDDGCCMDFSSPSLRRDSLSPLTFCKPFVLGRTLSSEKRETVGTYPQSEHVESPIEPGSSKVSLPLSLKSWEVVLSPAHDFDDDVDDILCLNPCSSSAARGLSDNAVHGPNMGKGDEHVGENREKQKKDTNLSEEEDKGYSSVSCIKNLESWRNLSPSADPQLPSAASPQIGTVAAKKLVDDCQPQSSPEQGIPKQAARPEKDISFLAGDLSPVVIGPLLSSSEESLEGGEEEVLVLGPPRFESSICQKVSETLDDVVEQVSEELKGNKEQISGCQGTLSSLLSTLDSTYEETILPPVKVKSVVVAASHPNSDQNRNPGFQPSRTVHSARSSRETDLEKKKLHYVHSVRRHMNEKPRKDPDVVKELQCLMTNVADKTDVYGGEWQHPADLTRRNYSKRCRNVGPKVPLSEWQTKTMTYKRFAKVPRVFRRTPFP